MRTPVDRCRWKRSRVAGSGRYRCRRRAAGRYWWRSGAADGGGGGWQVLGIVMFSSSLCSCHSSYWSWSVSFCRVGRGVVSVSGSVCCCCSCCSSVSTCVCASSIIK